jgi:hypothetical protein
MMIKFKEGPIEVFDTMFGTAYVNIVKIFSQKSSLSVLVNFKSILFNANAG